MRLLLTILISLLVFNAADAGITNYRTSRSRTPIYRPAPACSGAQCVQPTADETQILPFRRPGILKPDPAPPVNPADPPKFDFADDEPAVEAANSDVVLDGIKQLLEHGDSGLLHTLLLIAVFLLSFRKGKTASVKGVVDAYIDAKKHLNRAEPPTNATP